MLSAGIILCAGVLAIVVAAARGWSRAYLAYSLICLPLAAGIALGGTLTLTSDVRAAAGIIRWQTAMTLLSLPALFWFTALYTRQRVVAPWLGAAVALAAVLLALNFTTPYGLRFATLQALEPLRLPWGEALQRFGGEIDPPPYHVTRAFIWAVFLWILVRSAIHFRAGARRAAILLAAVVAVFIVSTLQSYLVDLGVLPSVPLSSVSNLCLVALLAISLGLDLKDQADALALTTRRLNAELEARREAEITLAYRAFHDPVTGLGNRARLQEWLRGVVAEARDGGSHAALMTLNLDAFKPVKATYGHEVADRLLRLVGERICDAVPPGWTVFDLGGDEFAIVSRQMPDAAGLERAARDAAGVVIERLRVPLSLDQRQIRITASAGVVLASGAGADSEDLLRAAGIAMIDAKAGGGNRYSLFEAGMEQAAHRRADLERGLLEALESEGLALQYQPQVDAAGRIIAAEALLRWHYAGHGPVSPAEFIPIAERTGIIHALGEWVVGEAVRTIAEGPPGAWRVAVNVSPWELLRPDYPDRVERALRAASVDPGRLMIEVTEGVMVHRLDDVVANMGRLRDLGVHLSIDDFGTGYSSLGYLRRLPLDQLKIDKTFVDDLEHPGHDTLVKSIAQIGHALGLQVLAEGIETEEQRRLLFALGCHAVQGYLMYRPLDKAAFLALLARPNLVLV